MYHIYSIYNDFGSYSHICHVAIGSNMKLELDLNKLTRRYCKVLHSRTKGVFAKSNFVRSPPANLANVLGTGRGKHTMQMPSVKVLTVYHI